MRLPGNKGRRLNCGQQLLHNLQWERIDGQGGSNIFDDEEPIACQESLLREQGSKMFQRLSAGGKVRSPLKKEFWGDTFGALTDRFGVDWMVNISVKKE